MAIWLPETSTHMHTHLAMLMQFASTYMLILFPHAYIGPPMCIHDLAVYMYVCMHAVYGLPHSPACASSKTLTSCFLQSASQQAPLSPVQQPIHPPYEAAGLLKRKQVAEKLPEVTSETLQAEHVVTGTVTL